jgi:hypothetical protein
MEVEPAREHSSRTALTETSSSERVSVGLESAFGPIAASNIAAARPIGRRKELLVCDVELRMTQAARPAISR